MSHEEYLVTGRLPIQGKKTSYLGKYEFEIHAYLNCILRLSVMTTDINVTEVRGDRNFAGSWLRYRVGSA